jgi:hypothetical protein
VQAFTSSHLSCFFFPLHATSLFFTVSSHFPLLTVFPFFCLTLPLSYIYIFLLSPIFIFYFLSLLPFSFSSCLYFMIPYSSSNFLPAFPPLFFLLAYFISRTQLVEKIIVIIRKVDLIPGPTLSAVPWFFVEPPYGCITKEYCAVVHGVSGKAYFLDEDRKCHRAML